MSMRTALPVLALGTLLLAACSGADERPAGQVLAMAGTPDAHAHHGGGDVGMDAPATGMSLFHLDSRWTDQHGTARQLGDLRGRPHLIAMVYTNCGSACPLIVGDMKQLEAMFPDLGFVLVSIDPERDTPGRLLEIANGSRLSDRWTLLNGDEEQLMELAAVLGVRYRRVSGNDFMHSNVITLLNAAGEIVHRQEALGEIEGTIAAVRALAAGGGAAD